MEKEIDTDEMKLELERIAALADLMSQLDAQGDLAVNTLNRIGDMIFESVAKIKNQLK